MIRPFTILPALLLFAVTLWGQRFDNFTFKGGIFATGTQSYIKDIYTTMIDESIYVPTQHEIREMHAIGGRVAFRACYPESNFFLEGNFSITGNFISPEPLEGGHFYLNNDRGLEYRIIFDYQRTSLGLQLGYFVLGQDPSAAFGLYTVAGLNWGIAAGSRILYNSSEPEYDLGVQQALRDGLKLRNDMGLVLGGGLQYRFYDSPVALELRYNYEWGVTDIIETQANPFYYRETPHNNTRFHQLTFGVLFSFYE